MALQRLGGPPAPLVQFPQSKACIQRISPSRLGFCVSGSNVRDVKPIDTRCVVSSKTSIAPSADAP